MKSVYYDMLSKDGSEVPVSHNGKTKSALSLNKWLLQEVIPLSILYG